VVALTHGGQRLTVRDGWGIGASSQLASVGRGSLRPGETCDLGPALDLIVIEGSMRMYLADCRASMRPRQQMPRKPSSWPTLAARSDQAGDQPRFQRIQHERNNRCCIGCRPDHDGVS
jgi:hypothetical protein